MSHITTVETKITDLEALKLAARELGASVSVGQTTWGYYAGQKGKCAHAIKMPGAGAYEVGVVQAPEGHFTLAYDFYGEGQVYRQAFGNNCQRLVQTYAKHAAVREFRKKGFRVQVMAEQNGHYRLQVSRGA